jgi:hypothetical protein
LLERAAGRLASLTRFAALLPALPAEFGMFVKMMAPGEPRARDG